MYIFGRARDDGGTRGPPSCRQSPAGQAEAAEHLQSFAWCSGL